MGKIEINCHNPLWVTFFEEEKAKIINALGEIVENVHHIGSTSVLGLSAKPIIDIILEVKELEQLDQYSNKLIELGYEAKGEFGIPRRRYFQKGGDGRTHQIHAFETNDQHILRHLAFSDYLKANHQVCKEYEELKIKVAKSCDNNIDIYCSGKDSFIKRHEVLAMQWYENNKRKNKNLDIGRPQEKNKKKK